MALKFFNVRSGETLIAENEPQISALWGTSDRSPNATQGQDMGWRIAPEVVVEMKKIQGDESIILDIAKRYAIQAEDVDEKAILQYISDKTDPEKAITADVQDLTDEYHAEIRRLEGKDAIDVETLEDKSVEELEAEIARRKALEKKPKKDKEDKE